MKSAWRPFVEEEKGGVKQIHQLLCFTAPETNPKADKMAKSQCAAKAQG